MRKIIIFESVHFTIKADKYLKEMGVNYKIITTPREISSECGMSIETPVSDFEYIKKLLDEKEFKMTVYEVE